MRHIIITLLISLALAACEGTTQLQVTNLFSDGMVMQADRQVTLWGTASPGTRINFAADWGFSTSTTATHEGKWEIQFSSIQPDHKPHQLVIATSDTVVIADDVYFGEVWLASGQSNMEMPLSGWATDSIEGSEKAISRSDDIFLRFFVAEKKASLTRMPDIEGEWVEATPETSGKFSATAYHFARHLRDSLRVPVGVVVAAWGGTPIEAWIDPWTLSQDSAYTNVLQENKQLADELDIYARQLGRQSSSPLHTLDSDPYLRFAVGNNAVTSRDHSIEQWSDITLPAYWEPTIGPIDGVVWFARDVEIPASWLRDKLVLHLGQIDDRDQTFINGVEIGRHETDMQYNVSRDYKITPKALSNRRLRIAVRVTDTSGGGGFVAKEGEMRIENRTKGISQTLEGKWKYCVETEFINGQAYHFSTATRQWSLLVKPALRLTSDLPAVLYNGMISPLKNYTFRGVIWYQGESNVGHAEDYVRRMQLLVYSWRKRLGSNIPFYAVQIAPYAYDGCSKTSSALLREAQRRAAQQIENCEIISTLDIGNCKTIHPSNKYEVGRRLALQALRNVYGRRDLVASGPEVDEVLFSDKFVMVRFLSAEGLHLSTEGDNEFEIAGPDGVFYPATSIIGQSQMTLFSYNVDAPCALRYAPRNCSRATLFNSSGLPAPSFMTDKVLKE